ncbi:MAG: cytochrome c [Actinomycetota bacterium]|nr:cytochrome c [Actinomycetota bacterium]
MSRLRRWFASSLAFHAFPVLLVMATTVVVLVGCGTPTTNSTATPAPQAPAVVNGPPGAALYTKSCARCHGSSGQGKGSTPKLDTVRLASLGDQPLRMAIAYGKGEMPGFGGLSDAQVTELISYLKGL